MKKICRLTIIYILHFSTAVCQSSVTASAHQQADSGKSVADSSDDNDDVRSYDIGLDYGSDQSYHGLHSTVKLPYLEPNFTYTAPSGFYTALSAQYILIKKIEGFDALDLNPGWDIDFGDNTSLDFNLSHYFFKHNTPLIIRSDLSDAVETYMEQWLGETRGKFSIDYDYYKKSSKVKTPGDFILTPDIMHRFKIKLSEKTSISIKPEGSIDFGTRNAYTHLQANVGDTAASKHSSKSNESFGTLDYNLMLPIALKIGNFEFEPALNYTAPLFKPAGTPTSPITYLTVTLMYTIDHTVHKVNKVAN